MTHQQAQPTAAEDAPAPGLETGAAASAANRGLFCALLLAPPPENPSSLFAASDLGRQK